MKMEIAMRFVLVTIVTAQLSTAAAEATPARRSALTDAPGIELVADLPDDPAFAGYGPKGEVQLDLGYAYREISVFWMPLWAYKTDGLVMFAGEGADLALSPVNDAVLAQIKDATGIDHSGYRFPFWEHLWGWLPIVGLGLLWMMRRRAALRREAELGLM